MNEILRYICFSVIFHTMLLFLICAAPQAKKPKHRIIFKEKFVAPLAIKPPQTITPLATSQTKVYPSIPKPQGQPIPKAIPKPKSLPKKQPSPLEPKPEAKQHIEESNQKNKEIKNAATTKQLKALAELTEALSKHLDKSTTNLENFSLPSTPQLTMSSSLEELHENELCELLKDYIALPTPGEVRIKLTLSPSGIIEECLFLSVISPVDKQLLLNRIQTIPFQNFLSKHKVSKNISFHIKLLSNDV